MDLISEKLEGRNAHEAGIALLSRLYRQKTGLPLPEIRKSPRGKPYFPDGKLHFSISHTPHRVFCCLSARNVGMDAEEVQRQIPLRMAQRLLSPGELARFDAAEDKRSCLLRLWVLKEAYAKLTGRGIGNYLKNTDFSPDDPRIQIIDGCYVAVLEEGDTYAV